MAEPCRHLPGSLPDGESVKERDIATDDVSLHVVECGEGPAVMFCHGFSDTGRSWRRQMFQQMRPAADNEWADARKTLPAAFYWTSGEAPKEARWHPMDIDRGLLRPAPSGLPSFVDPTDFAVMVGQFERNGFHRPLNDYRALESCLRHRFSPAAGFRSHLSCWLAQQMV